MMKYNHNKVIKYLYNMLYINKYDDEYIINKFNYYNQTVTWFWIEKIKNKQKGYNNFDEFINNNTNLLCFDIIYNYYPKYDILTDKYKKIHKIKLNK